MPNQLIFLFLFNMDNLNIYSTIDLQKIITCISFIIAIVNIILKNGINQQFLYSYASAYMYHVHACKLLLYVVFKY